jgi:hypothetical protein
LISLYNFPIYQYAYFVPTRLIIPQVSLPQSQRRVRVVIHSQLAISLIGRANSLSTTQLNQECYRDFRFTIYLLPQTVQHGFSWIIQYARFLRGKRFNRASRPGHWITARSLLSQRCSRLFQGTFFRLQGSCLRSSPSFYLLFSLV